jgi:hypothetical protein
MASKKVLDEASKAIRKALNSKKGKSFLENYFKEEAERKKKQESVLADLKKHFESEEGAFEKYVKYTIKENRAKIKKCIKDNGVAYEKNEKGDFCEISPTDKFYILWRYFQKYGEDTYAKAKDKTFLAESYTIGEFNYTIRLFQGQGCFWIVYKNGRRYFTI